MGSLDDKIYLLRKMQMEVRADINEYSARKELYEKMSEMMSEYNVRNSQERFLVSDLHKLINFFESKSDVGYIKLRDIESELNILQADLDARMH
jgi:hypothetical protein